MEGKTVEGLLPVTDEIITDILKNRDERLLAIRERRIHAMEFIRDTDSMILEASMPGQTDNPRGSGPPRQKDLGDVYGNYREKLRQRRKDLKYMLRELMLMEERIARVWACFMALPDPEYSIADDLLVKGRKWDDARRDYGDYNAFVRNRRRAMSLIKEYYASGMTPSGLFESGEKRRREEAKRPKSPLHAARKRGIPGQINLPGMEFGKKTGTGVD